MRAEGFSCSSLGVLYGGQTKSKLQLLTKKNINFFQLEFLAIKTLDSDLQLEKMLDPDPH